MIVDNLNICGSVCRPHEAEPPPWTTTLRTKSRKPLFLAKADQRQGKVEGDRQTAIVLACRATPTVDLRATADPRASVPSRLLIQILGKACPSGNRSCRHTAGACFGVPCLALSPVGPLFLSSMQRLLEDALAERRGSFLEARH